MFKSIFAVTVSLVVVGPDAQYRGRSLRRVWFAAMLALMLGLSCLSGVVNANPAPIQSVVLTTTAEGIAPANAVNAAQARMMARRAAMAVLVHNACQEVGAVRGTVRAIRAEAFDGCVYTVTADVQVWSR